MYCSVRKFVSGDFIDEHDDTMNDLDDYNYTDYSYNFT